MVLHGQFGISLLMTVLITVCVPDHSNCLQPILLNNLKIALWYFSSTVADYLLLVHHLWITELFKNTRTLKFKSQPRFGFLLPSIILIFLLGNSTFLKRVQKVMVCDLWLVDFDPFCVSVFQGSLLVIVIMIDGSEKRNREGAFWTLEFACLWKAQKGWI